MTRLLVVTILTVILAAAGCQSCHWRPWGNTPAATAPPATYGVPGSPPHAYVNPPTSTGSCGPGCTSCSPPSLPALSGPQVYAPSDRTN